MNKRKQIVKFSIRKYRKWCKENNCPVYKWADECKNKPVHNWNGCNGLCTKTNYIIIKPWVVIKYE